ncbi:RtcB family protein [Meiothermus hypogaeus]|uniref:tRNA-splicing ligase RtcB n=2 Tax=Meiothermus hypogaeus TaxID=884155 RepID=A0A511R370_9DEIN|nr:RtcB family protein [Meiothermus hypogaeus]RIH75624.1 RNA-splicing ligase RtcB [Meiothermus hypogaeus]GEM84049.1 RNA-splicing ligase RtcB [Meiothermus hypogaeus NBRC 106114]
MDTTRLTQKSAFEWWLEASPPMRVPGILYANEALLREMDDKVLEQMANVASLPGIVQAVYAMPDAHWGYGFPIGGVAAFREDDGVVSAGGVGFDISCGVRTMHTGLTVEDIEPIKEDLAQGLFRHVPAGVGSIGKIHLEPAEMDAMLQGGAEWAVKQGYGRPEDLERIEEHGRMEGARPELISLQAKRRQADEMGTLGSGNHYLEVQQVTEVFDTRVAEAFGVAVGDVLVSIHSGSRGLGHQVATDYSRQMVEAAHKYGLELADLELACAPIQSEEGQAYLGAMRAAINCALANRQILTHLAREAFAYLLPRADLRLIYDVSHNTAKLEEHLIEGKPQRLYVHRKGATRAFGPGHPALPEAFRAVGQPVLIGGTMGTASYILVGTPEGEARSLSSSCHGAGRAMSRHQALKQWRGKELVRELGQRGIIVRSPSPRGVAEEAPGAYKDVTAVVDAAHAAGLSRKVARLEPLICIKG